MGEGSITVDGETYGPRTGIELLPTDTPVEIVANEDTLFLAVHLPKF
jgi:hypothetical protein